MGRKKKKKNRSEAKVGARAKNRKPASFPSLLTLETHLKKKKKFFFLPGFVTGGTKIRVACSPTFCFPRKDSRQYRGEDEMAAAPSLCVLRYFNSWNKNLRKEGLCSLLLRTSSLFIRHYCSSNLVGVACATALRSPDLVALEYADLNLTHKVSEVSFFFFFFFFLLKNYRYFWNQY